MFVLLFFTFNFIITFYSQLHFPFIFKQFVWIGISSLLTTLAMALKLWETAAEMQPELVVEDIISHILSITVPCSLWQGRATRNQTLHVLQAVFIHLNLQMWWLKKRYLKLGWIEHVGEGWKLQRNRYNLGVVSWSCQTIKVRVLWFKNQRALTWPSGMNRSLSKRHNLLGKIWLWNSTGLQGLAAITGTNFSLISARIFRFHIWPSHL